MTELILVRHGQTLSNTKNLLQGQSDGLLTEEGRQQARTVAAVLKNRPIDRIISSPLIRAKDTAAEIAKYHDSHVIIHPLIGEWDCGTLDGLPAAALFEARRKAGVPLAEFRPDGGETLIEVQNRARLFLNEIGKSFSGNRILVCSHGDFLRMLISLILGFSIEEANGIHLENAAYSDFVNENGTWVMRGLNLRE